LKDRRSRILSAGLQWFPIDILGLDESHREHRAGNWSAALSKLLTRCSCGFVHDFIRIERDPGIEIESKQFPIERDGLFGIVDGEFKSCTGNIAGNLSGGSRRRSIQLQTRDSAFACGFRANWVCAMIPRNK
jgi:hypothetical protein